MDIYEQNNNYRLLLKIKLLYAYNNNKENVKKLEKLNLMFSESIVFVNIKQKFQNTPLL